VQAFVQNTSDDKMLAKTKRRVGQMEKAARERMATISHNFAKVRVVSGRTGTVVDIMDTEEEISPDFIKCITWLKWECLRAGVSLVVQQCLFPKHLI
jgi:hypothetical protein